MVSTENHIGVHYPADVAAGALLGIAIAQLSARALDPGRGSRR
jgi:membrane-associated phospholipid phosphatase